MATLTIVVDYPDEFIDKYGTQDAADTFRARLDEVYPGPAGAELLQPAIRDIRVERGLTLTDREIDLIRTAVDKETTFLADEPDFHDLLREYEALEERLK